MFSHLSVGGAGEKDRFLNLNSSGCSSWSAVMTVLVL
jgi:hypothetical protein